VRLCPAAHIRDCPKHNTAVAPAQSHSMVMVMGGRLVAERLRMLMHFMTYCGGYATIRVKYSGLFGRARINGGNDAQA
jgi:hypothetical protein